MESSSFGIDASLDKMRNWWKSNFGISLRFDDFEQVVGPYDLLMGVLEELLLNALVSVSHVHVVDRRWNIDSAFEHDEHDISVEVESSLTNGDFVISIKNWSSRPLDDDESSRRRPEAGRGWGLYGTRLLMDTIGSLDVWQGGHDQAANAFWPIRVGFSLLIQHSKVNRRNTHA